jgi:hypothetical protein
VGLMALVSARRPKWATHAEDVHGRRRTTASPSLDNASCKRAGRTVDYRSRTCGSPRASSSVPLPSQHERQASQPRRRPTSDPPGGGVLVVDATSNGFPSRRVEHEKWLAMAAPSIGVVQTRATINGLEPLLYGRVVDIESSRPRMRTEPMRFRRAVRSSSAGNVGSDAWATASESETSRFLVRTSRRRVSARCNRLTGVAAGTARFRPDRRHHRSRSR